MSTIFFTGFPGFLGSELVPRVLDRSEDTSAICLIQEKFADLAQERVAEIEEIQPELAGRIRLVEGDITRPGLELGSPSELGWNVSEIYHLAAVYDLSVPRDVGVKVNVDGTRHMLDWAEKCSNLDRFHYVSTCYVSGRYAGIFREEDLDKGQQFNNFYEETKFLAEAAVQRRMREGFPATIYRPSIVVGDSRTGETQKYDGPYYVIRWILRQLIVAVVPAVGDPSTVRVNLVPRDFVIDAMSYLSGIEESAGKVYQLADPEPLTVEELLEGIGEASGKWIVKLPLPLGAAKAAINHIPGVYWLMGIPSEAVDYFVHPTHYLCTNTLADLEGSGIELPSIRDYLAKLVKFVKKHPEISAEAMV